VHYPQNGATTAPSEAANPWIRGVAEALADLVRGETGEPLEAVDRFRTLLETADDLLIGDPEGWRLQQREERLRLMFEEVHELRVSMQREVVTRESVMSQLATLRSALSDRLDAAVDTFRVAQNTLENEHQKEFADEVTRGRQRIESLEADLESTRREFELVERRVADASDAVSRQSRQLDYVEKSLSWRVTAPARAILRLIRSFVAPVAGRH
jgi:chromosome segregation ATPase